MEELERWYENEYNKQQMPEHLLGGVHEPIDIVFDYARPSHETKIKRGIRIGGILFRLTEEKRQEYKETKYWGINADTNRDEETEW